MRHGKGRAYVEHPSHRSFCFGQMAATHLNFHQNPKPPGPVDLERVATLICLNASSQRPSVRESSASPCSASALPGANVATCWNSRSAAVQSQSYSDMDEA